MMGMFGRSAKAGGEDVGHMSFDQIIEVARQKGEIPKDQASADIVKNWCEKTVSGEVSAADHDALKPLIQSRELEFSTLFALLHAGLTSHGAQAGDAVFYHAMTAMHDVKEMIGATSKAGDNRKMLMDFADLLEREATNTVGEVAHKAAKFILIARSIARDSEGLQLLSCEVAETAHRFSEDVAEMAETATKLEDLCRYIQDEVEKTGVTSQSARTLSGEASEAVIRLNTATEQISGVVSLIQNIANQTRMLSLNATIEAARAGDFGKGFAVVASEVKQLAGETKESISQVSDRAAEIASEARDTTQNITDIEGAIASVDDHTQGIQNTANEQMSSARDISMRMADASGKATEVSERISAIFQQAQMNLQASQKLSEMAEHLGGDMDGLRKKILDIVGVSNIRDDHLRVPAALPVTIDGRFHGMITDLSQSGALIKPEDINRMGNNKESVLRIEGVGDIQASILMRNPDTMHMSFHHMTPDQKDKLKTMITDTLERDDHFGKVCIDRSKAIEAAFQHAINEGKATLEDFLSDRLEPIPGTDPQQYKSPVVDLTDRLITDIQDQTLEDHPEFILCCSIDRNAYIGTHNRKYSQPQKANDPVWNAGNSRNRRIFDDKAGLLAAHNLDALLTQTYERDMGGGVFVFLKEVDAPIYLNGPGGGERHHWGNLRIGYKA